ncbi:MAG: nucleoside triphosphate pyrophosphohydrolase [Congregibacter sp.]|nr:nucleoside triphosphate pyrophosphohydrolase [Congregibacter sp.]
MSKESISSGSAVEGLLEIMRALRDPVTGCPWDLRQDFDSIVPFTIEETYELAAAIAAKDPAQICDELGDVLFQVVFYAQIASEKSLFDFADVASAISAKLVRRHPHVFDAQGEVPVTETEVKERWEAIKEQERSLKNQNGILDDVPLALPSLSRAQKLQKRAAAVGFDWPDLAGVFAKVEEEIAELEEAVEQGDAVAIEDEVGDVFLTVVNLARHLNVDAEAAVRKANSRFESRFQLMEIASEADGSRLRDEDPGLLEQRWQTAKQQLASNVPPGE